jgi:carboxymethylenebutenolidase
MPVVDVTIPATDGTVVRGVCARPHGSPPPGGWPGVVVLHEVMGIVPEVVRAAERFAAVGWVAVIPDLFSHGTRLGCVVRALTEVLRGRPGRVHYDIEDARRWLAGQPDVDAQRLAVIGFCMGGSFALTFAMGRPPGVRAMSVNYGNVPRSADEVAGLCPTVGSYGRRDMLFGKQGDRLATVLTDAGVEHDVRTYDDAGHGFVTDGHHPVAKLVFFPLRYGHVPGAAEDAWQRIFAFFDKHVLKQAAE